MSIVNVYNYRKGKRRKTTRKPEHPPSPQNHKANMFGRHRLNEKVGRPQAWVPTNDSHNTLLRRVLRRFFEGRTSWKASLEGTW